MSGFISDNLLEKLCAFFFFLFSFFNQSAAIFFSAQWETNMLKGNSVIFLFIYLFFNEALYLRFWECKCFILSKNV